MARRKLGSVKKGSSVSLTKHSKIYVSCSKCGRDVIIDANAVSGICSICVCLMGGPPPSHATIKKSDKPKGWKWMSVFVDADGNVYHEGEEQPNLKGTLPPTDVEKIRANQKAKRGENKKKRAEKEVKREQKLVAEFEKKKKLKKKVEEAQQKRLDELEESKKGPVTPEKPAKSVKVDKAPKKAKVEKKPKKAAKKTKIKKVEKKTKNKSSKFF